MNLPPLKLRAVCKSFGANKAVQDLELEVPAGSLCGFLGPNGAGKTTAIRIIMSILLPDSGTVEVLGGSALDNKDRIGYLPEERGLYRRMRVGEFLEYVAALKGVTRRGLAHDIKQWLDRLELPLTYRQRCQELSKGMQQKIQFLAAIIHDPDLLILDEPFSGLDPVNTSLVSRLIEELHQRGKTIIFSTHILHQAEQLCDRCFLINNGIKLLDATIADIRAQFDPRTIEVEPLNADDAASSLLDIPGIDSVSNGRSLELFLKDGAEPRSIMKQVIERCDVRSLRLRRITLEEVFVRLVRADLAAEDVVRMRRELTDA
ncbi:MAG: ATP-binding cassette domain-containing protein [Candidatus Schekmanbacteria bacterium]|nr:ATP-binding cassette domain-containing protein [Candidatus Schekmanbacteria bacterium]